MYWSEKQRELVKIFYPQHWNYLHFLNRNFKNYFSTCWSGEEDGAQEALATEMILWRFCQNKAGCGHCQACRQVLAETHPDLLVIKKKEGGKFISLSEAKKINLFLSTRPFTGENKIIYLQNAEFLTLEATNSLLKKSEELRQGFYLVCTTSHLEKIPKTLSSRLVIFKLSPIKKNDLVKHLRRNLPDNEPRTAVEEFISGLFFRINLDKSEEKFKDWQEKTIFWRKFMEASIEKREILLQEKIFMQKRSPEEINLLFQILVNYLRRRTLREMGDKMSVTLGENKKRWHNIRMVDNCWRMWQENVNPKLIFNYFLGQL